MAALSSSRMVSTEAKNGYIYIDLFKIIDTRFIMDVIGTLLYHYLSITHIITGKSYSRPVNLILFLFLST